MSQFKGFSEAIQNQFKLMTATGMLFRSKTTGRELWTAYLAAFSPEDDDTFRDPDSSSHTCKTCNNFIRRYGNILAVDEKGNLMSLFSNLDVTAPYLEVSKIIDSKLIEAGIGGVFVETFSELNLLPYEACKKDNTVFKLGVEKNLKKYTADEAKAFGVVDTKTIYEFFHFYLELPNAFVDKSGDSVEAVSAGYNDKHSVFKRAMEEIDMDAFTLAKELILQGSLLDGTSHIHAIEKYIKFHKTKPENNLESWYWTMSFDMADAVAKFRNTAAGRLCKEISEGKELKDVCLMWNKMVDPVNYHKATAPITQAQIDLAEKFVEENGYTESFDRRLGTAEDMSPEEIKHINADESAVAKVSLFNKVKPTKSVTAFKESDLKGAEEIGIDDFLKNVVPQCKSVEAFFKNAHQNNLVTITTANNPDSKPMFKWNNNYSWSFNGNLAGKSQLTQAVEDKGGRTDGAFRFTHSWNKLEPNNSLMDLHVFMPDCTLPQPSRRQGPSVGGRYVGWNHRNDSLSGGTQDVDHTKAASAGFVPVENITFPDVSRMPEGVYTCMINNWKHRGTSGRGEAEVAIFGDVYQYVYPETKNNEWVTVARVTLKDGAFTIEHVLEESNASKEVWGIKTNQFHKVNLLCLSPNHWGENAVGNKHFMFMLDGCKSDAAVRGFHNENLNEELLKHRKVMEVLGSTSMIEPLDDKSVPCLAGLGFNSTVRDEVIVRVKGLTSKMFKIKF